MPPPPKNSPYRLLVEGPDDQHAVTHLMKRHGFDWDPGLPFGTALTARVLGHDSPEARQFAEWFRRLFV